MNCPKCQTVMREREKGDIIIDICPGCRGIFLDAGELEKLVAAEERVFERRGWDYDGDDDDDRPGYREENRGRVQTYEARSPQYQPKEKEKLPQQHVRELRRGRSGRLGRTSRVPTDPSGVHRRCRLICVCAPES